MVSQLFSPSQRLSAGLATDPTVSRDPAALPERNGKGGVGHFPPLFWARGRSPLSLSSPQVMGNEPSSGRRGNDDEKLPRSPRIPTPGTADLAHMFFTESLKF